MKRFLLSSIIMLGVCGAVNAQNATGAKVKKNEMATSSTSSASAVAPTPQKAAVMAVEANVAAPAEKTAADKEGASVAPMNQAQNKAAVRAKQAVTAEAKVDAAGVTVMSDEEKDIAAKKAEKAAQAKKSSN